MSEKSYHVLTGLFVNEGQYGKFMGARLTADKLEEALGFVRVNGGEVYVNVTKNRFKEEGDNKPDYTVMFKPVAGLAKEPDPHAPATGFDGTEKSSAPAESATVDLPF